MLTGGGVGIVHGDKEYLEVGRDYLSQWPYLDSIKPAENKIPTKNVVW